MPNVLRRLRFLPKAKRIEFFELLWKEFKWELEYALMPDSLRNFYNSDRPRPDQLT